MNLVSVDRVIVKLLQNFLHWITDEVAQLLSNEILKRFGQNMNKQVYVEDLNSLQSEYTNTSQLKIQPLFNTNFNYL